MGTATVSKSFSVATIKPLGDRVVIQGVCENDVTPGGIVLPDTAKEKPQKGNVIAVGPGKMTDQGKHIPMTVAVGDRVLFTKYGPTEITVGNEEYLIVSESDILGVLEGDL